MTDREAEEHSNGCEYCKGSKVLGFDGMNDGIRMKAWLVREKYEFCATVVFAETKGKAKVLAMSTDCCEGVDFINIEAVRMKEADKYYQEGKTEMDWYNDADKIALVKDCGFVCDIDYIELKDCVDCAAKEYCDQYIDLMERGGKGE